MDQFTPGVNKNTRGISEGVPANTGKVYEVRCGGTVTAPGFAPAAFLAGSKTPAGRLIAQQAQ
jgi:hypothetical protein